MFLTITLKGAKIQINLNVKNISSLKSKRGVKMVDTNKLKSIMALRGVTQKEAAEVIGITATSFSYKLHNKSEFVSSEVLALSDWLGIVDKDEVFLLRNLI